MSLDFTPRQPYADCLRCPLVTAHYGRLNPCVSGYGRQTTPIVLVGEAPGETELVVRQPFRGASGRLLDKLLTGAEIAREDVYITNAVSCASRQGNANVPVPQAAIKACQARLFEEVRRREPEVVVALGSAALKAFGVEESITACRGREQWISAERLRAVLAKGRSKRDAASLHFDQDWARGGFYLLPTFHPAYLLRNPDLYPDSERDFTRLVTLLTTPAAQRREAPTFTVTAPTATGDALSAIAQLSQASVLACDIEATSKDFYTDRLLTVAYAMPGDPIQCVVLPVALLDNAPIHDALRCLHAREDIRFLWWNGKFDRKWYVHHLGIDVRIDGDGMLAHYAVDPRRGIHGLKQRASDDLDADDYEAEIRAYTGRGQQTNYGNIPYDKLVQYTSEDVGMTLLLTQRYEAELARDPPTQYVYQHILLPAAVALSYIEMVGFTVDQAALIALDAEFRTLLDGYEQQMREAAQCPTLNVSSYPQLVQVLYGDGVRQQFEGCNKATAQGLPTLNLPVIYNEQGTPSTGSDACDKLRQRTLTHRQEAFVVARQQHVLNGQLHRTYVRKLPTIVHPDGRVRTTFNLHTTRTGRLSSSDPFNLQNIPTRRKIGKRIKDAFVASPGQVLVEFDLSQAELRVAAFLSREPALLAVYREGRDFHHEVALRILGNEQRAKAMRPYIKTLNFAILYGAQVPTLTTLLSDMALEVEGETGTPQERWTRGRVQALYDTFWQQFPIFAAWGASQRRQAREQGFVVSHFGRKRRFPLITRENQEEVDREAVSHPVQSTAAELMTMCVARVYAWLRTQQLPPLRLLATVHDSLVGETLEEDVPAIARMVFATIHDIAVQHGIDVPITAECKIGQRWGSLVAYHAPSQAAERGLKPYEGAHDHAHTLLPV